MDKTFCYLSEFGRLDCELLKIVVAAAELLHLHRQRIAHLFHRPQSLPRRQRLALALPHRQVFTRQNDRVSSPRP